MNGDWVWRKNASVTTPPSCTPHRYAKRRDWEPYKERILEMRRQNIRLKDIRINLAAEGFHATESQYKKIFRSWGSKKYLNRAERRYIISTIAPSGGDMIPEFKTTYDGNVELVDHQKVMRVWSNRRRESGKPGCSASDPEDRNSEHRRLILGDNELLLGLPIYFGTDDVGHVAVASTPTNGLLENIKVCDELEYADEEIMRDWDAETDGQFSGEVALTPDQVSDLRRLLDLLGIPIDFQYGGTNSGTSSPLEFSRWNEAMQAEHTSVISRLALPQDTMDGLEFDIKQSYYDYLVIHPRALDAEIGAKCGANIHSTFEPFTQRYKAEDDSLGDPVQTSLTVLCDADPAWPWDSLHNILHRMADDGFDPGTIGECGLLDQISEDVYDFLQEEPGFPFFNEMSQSTTELFIQSIYVAAATAKIEGNASDHLDFCKLALNMSRSCLGVDHPWSCRILLMVSYNYELYAPYYADNADATDRIIPFESVKQYIKCMKSYPIDPEGCLTIESRRLHSQFAWHFWEEYDLIDLATCAARAALPDPEAIVYGNIADYLSDSSTLEALRCLFDLYLQAYYEGGVGYPQPAELFSVSDEIVKYLSGKVSSKDTSGYNLKLNKLWVELQARLFNYARESVRHRRIMKHLKDLWNRFLPRGEEDNRPVILVECFNLIALGHFGEASRRLTMDEGQEPGSRSANYHHLAQYLLGVTSSRIGKLDESYKHLQLALEGFTKTQGLNSRLSVEVLSSITTVLERRGLPIYARPVSHLLLKMEEMIYGSEHPFTLGSAIRAIRLSLRCNENLTKDDLRMMEIC